MTKLWLAPTNPCYWTVILQLWAKCLYSQASPAQETALNIFDGDALLFFPSFALHFSVALLRPALFLLRLPPDNQPIELKASVVVARAEPSSRPLGWPDSQQPVVWRESGGL
jgi:hypothetical protein